MRNNIRPLEVNSVQTSGGVEESSFTSNTIKNNGKRWSAAGIFDDAKALIQNLVGGASKVDDGAATSTSFNA